MPPHVLLPAFGSLHTSHQSYAMCFIGCRSPSELSSRSLCWLLTVFGAWGRRISRASVFPRLTTLPGPVFVLLNAATCSFLERGRSWEQGVSACLPYTVWNSLPTELRWTSVSCDTFKFRLKSHLYADAYLRHVWERSRLRQTMTLTLTLCRAGSRRNPVSQLRDVTCRMGSHRLTCHSTQVNASRRRLYPSQ